jgi:hypothetical protein
VKDLKIKLFLVILIEVQLASCMNFQNGMMLHMMRDKYTVNYHLSSTNQPSILSICSILSLNIGCP